MTSLAADINGMPIYNAAGQPLYQDTNGVIVDAAGQVTAVNPTTGLPTDTNGDDISQPPTVVRINALVAHTATTAATAAIATAGVSTVSNASTSAGVVFARAPGRLNRDLIDYSTKHGDAVYARATKSLYGEKEEKFALKEEDMLAFLNNVALRAKSCGWDIFSVQVSTSGTSPALVKNLLTQYGELTLAQVRDRAEAIAAAKDRTTQEDDQLFSCLMASLTKEAQNTVNLKKTDFMIGEENSGILLLKVILAKSQVDTRSTVTLLMGKVTTGMPNIMAAHSNNITAFNAEVNEIIQKLEARGKGGAELDLTPQLFTTYQGCSTSDAPFYRYIETLENAYNDGSTNLTTKTLMEKAEIKYEELKDKAKLTMGGKTNLSADTDVVALRAELDELKSQVAVSRGKQDANRRSNRGSGRNPPAWVTEKPVDGKLVKEVNGKQYHWCDGDSGKNHAPKWVIHKPSECTNQKKSSGTKPEASASGNNPTWTTSMLAALQAEHE